MWAPRAMDLERLRQVKGLEKLENRACTDISDRVHPNLTHLSEAMEPAIEQVSDRVYNAVGFDVANSTFVIGDDGVVVIDAMLVVENMTAALEAFREICDYPVAGVLYTHSHGDHWGGSPALVSPGDGAAGRIPVVAHRLLMPEVARINGYNSAIMAARASYQFGHYLESSPDGRVNVGAGPFMDPTQTVGLIAPNLLVEDRLEIEIAGLRMEIVWVPSEAPDEVAVWFPDLRVLQTAECIQGECFPNVYPLRGDVPRPAAQWVASIDELRRFPAEALAKSHGRSVVGRRACQEHLENYRDALAWTHDQTVRFMNQGYVPDQIADKLVMPPHLRAYETTGLEGYGTVGQASRSVYSWYLGFNRGEVTDFDPAPYDQRQRRYVEAIGGADRVCDLAEESMRAGDNRWAIELLGYVVRSDPAHSQARSLAADAHRREGLTKSNATWRNWYLTAAEELEGTIPARLQTSAMEILTAMSVRSILAGLPVRLRAELAWYVSLALVVAVGGEEGGEFSLLLRRGVLEIADGGVEDPDARIHFHDKVALVDYLIGQELSGLVDSGRARVDGNRAAAERLRHYLDPVPDPSRIRVTLHQPVG